MNKPLVYASAAVIGLGVLALSKGDEIKEYVSEIRRKLHRKDLAKNPEKIYPSMQQ